MRRATISRLAEEADVSIATVNRVLSGKSGVRAETVQRVLAAAETINFYGTGTIRSRLRHGRAERRLGIVVQQPSMPFHKELGDLFRVEAERREDVLATVDVCFMEELDPHDVAGRLVAMGERCDALAVTSADHPAIDQAIEELAARGKPVFTAVSDLSAPSRAGYVGLDNRKFGRAAAWYATHLERRGNEIAILIGTHRHVCQEQREMGFRSFVREHAPALTVLEPITTHETDQGAFEITLDLLRRHPDLGVIYVTGGGIRGCLRGMREQPREARPLVIGCEHNADVRSALVEGLLTVSLAHPMQRLVQALIEAMVKASDDPAQWIRSDAILPFETMISENL